MIKKILIIIFILVFVSLISFSQSNQSGRSPSEITRITYSGNSVVHFPCLSDDGRSMLYILETPEGEEIKRSIRFFNLDTGTEKELFFDRQEKAPAPFEEISLMVGSKPPILSGDGNVAVFCVSVDEPANILDHYLAVVKTDGSGLSIFSFPIESLAGLDVKSLGFQNQEWERISNIAVSHQGNRIACLLKGHLGPRKFGNPSGIVMVDVLNKKQSHVLIPDFTENGWNWPSFPANPLIGGGWAFDMDEEGQSLVFGAQSSEDIVDYDLYIMDWDEKKPARLTDFHDRWFSLAIMSRDGGQIVFFYHGQANQGIGTYQINRDGSGLKFFESKVASRVELVDMSGDGRFILFKHIYNGMMIELLTGQEMVVFDEATPGVVTGLAPMDFPKFPSFWRPKIISRTGERILLAGVPEGGISPEVYMLHIDIK